jgi:hypothetical protein
MVHNHGLEEAYSCRENLLPDGSLIGECQMSFTSHGHNIPGTGWENPPDPASQVLCGGPRHCQTCQKDVEIFVGAPKNWLDDARELLRNHIEKQMLEVGASAFEVYVVWACKILQNWKGMLATTLPDGTYYEITYDGEKRRWYLDEYRKYENTIYPTSN